MGIEIILNEFKSCHFLVYQLLNEPGRSQGLLIRNSIEGFGFREDKVFILCMGCSV